MSGPHIKLTRLAAILMFTLFVFFLSFKTVAQTRRSLLIDLRAEDVSAGSETWINKGDLGDFKRLGSPQRVVIRGVTALQFDGLNDAYRGPVTNSALEGAAPRTIEVWAYNESVDSDEETLVAWGRRGHEGGSMLGFGWGKSGAYGAATHWANDLGWNGPPAPKHWHYLAYVYDGKTVRLYDDAVEKNSRDITLNTASGSVVSIGVPNGSDGSPLFKNEYNGSQMGGSLAISVVRVHPRAMSPIEISEAFDLDAAKYGASRADAEGLLAKGTKKFDAGNLALSLMNATGTAASLSPKGSAFDFTPGDRLRGRTSEKYYHLGDATLRVRKPGAAWTNFSSASNRDTPVDISTPGTLASQDITANLGEKCPLQVVREWTKENGTLVLRFRLKNPSNDPVEIGAFGAAMVFNNLITGRSLDETHDKCSFADPYIGGGAGYLQVTRLNGQGPALLVLPENETSFEAYRPLYDDPTSRDVTFEGFYEWMVHTKAYAQNEWKLTQPWNPATSRTLKSGESAIYGFRFVLAPSVREIESTLIKQKRPVVFGVPGYVIATDQNSKLFIRYSQRPSTLVVEPKGALKIGVTPKKTPSGWLAYDLKGEKPGRCRISIAYADGRKQNIHYFVTPPDAEQIKKLGQFHAEKQWFSNPNDAFGRTFSFLPYNREKNEMVVQHSHTWFSGLSDEIGAGASVAMAMKNLGRPDAREIALLEKYVTNVLWGKLQNPDYSVKASLFYYQPNLQPANYYEVRSGWDKARGESTWRSFNYPHVACVYWAMYHLSRDYQGLTKEHTWDWYLEHAFQTVKAIKKFAPGYAESGLMVGSVFPEIIRDLKKEGWRDKADELIEYMKSREKLWEAKRYPFGSEMPWDSTGQEEIYSWFSYFGADFKAKVTLDAILGYMPTVPNWAYNGAGRRYFDAPVNGTRWPDIVRMTNHYGSTINSIPVIDSFRKRPHDLLLLRVGYAGMNQILANIDSEGFASYGFDADPAILKFDPYTADYGIAFYGYAKNAGCYVVNDPEFGRLAFGGNVEKQGQRITIVPKDGFRKNIFIAELGLSLKLDAGQFEKVVYDPVKQSLSVTLAPKTGHTQKTHLIFETSSNSSYWVLVGADVRTKYIYDIRLSEKSKSIVLRNIIR